MACVDPETAARYVAHRLLPAEMRDVDRHIDGCSDCRAVISAVVVAEWSQDPEAGAAPSPGGVLPPGTQIGPFELGLPIDAGGMGLVYAARDTRLDRRVALKSLRELGGRSESLLREARMMAQLSHPNVVPVYDVIAARDEIFLAMELVVGSSVRQWLDAAPRGWRAVTDVFLAAGAGLAAAHAANIIHSDVKPANILRGDDGRIRVADFGLSFTRHGDAPAEGPRGTPAYMAPAQRAGQPCDAAGDQYAFCVSLHEAVFGALPGAPPVRTGRVPRALRRLIARGLSRDPADRFPSMNHLLRALRAVRYPRWRWALPAVAVALVLAVLAFRTGERRIQTSMCEGAASQLTSPWNADTRRDVRRAFHDTKLPYAPATLQLVEAHLDDWTRSFEAARAETCAGGWFDRSRDRLAGELACLEERAREARALVNQFLSLDATVVSNAAAASERLPALTACAALPDRPAAAPDSPARQQLADQFARSFALIDSGKYRDGLPVARANLAAAEAIGDPALIAKALNRLGNTQVALSDYETASGNLLRALQIADAIQDDRARAKAWVLLMQSEYGRGHHEQVVFMKAAALGAAQRIGDVWMQTEIMQFLGGALCELGRAGEALPLFEDAVRLRRQLYGDRDRRVALAQSSLGNGYAMQGNLEAGIAAHRQAVETATAALGPLHPNIGVLHANLGSDYLYGLQPARAIAEIEQALAVFEAGNGKQQRTVASARAELGFALLESGQAERAAAMFERADATWRQVNAKHPERAMALLGGSLAGEALGRPAAVADLETALALAKDAPAYERGRIQLALGRAASGPRAAELIGAAVTGLATSSLPLIQRELGLAKQWQRDHGGAP